jgi:hypothetical protein
MRVQHPSYHVIVCGSKAQFSSMVIPISQWYQSNFCFINEYCLSTRLFFYIKRTNVKSLNTKYEFFFFNLIPRHFIFKSDFILIFLFFLWIFFIITLDLFFKLIFLFYPLTLNWLIIFWFCVIFLIALILILWPRLRILNVSMGWH